MYLNGKVMDDLGGHRRTHVAANATTILRACSALGREARLYSQVARSRPSRWGLFTQRLVPPLPV